MAEYENTQYTDEMEFEVPKKSRETVKRLWKSMGRQRIRLMIVAVSVVFYTVLSSYLYSDRDSVHVSELSHGQLCRAPEPGASDKDQQETFKAASFLL